MASWPIAAVTGPLAFAVLAIAELLALGHVLRWRARVSERHGLYE